MGLRPSTTPAGRVGGLICWEHWMPLARQAMHDSAEDIHVAVWPNVHEMVQVASRHYAFEGRCFVLAAGSLLRARKSPARARAASRSCNVAVTVGAARRKRDHRSERRVHRGTGVRRAMHSHGGARSGSSARGAHVARRRWTLQWSGLPRAASHKQQAVEPQTRAPSWRQWYE